MTNEEMLAAFARREHGKLEEAFRIDQMREVVREMLDAGGTGLPVKIGFDIETDRPARVTFLDIRVETGNLLPMFGSYGSRVWAKARLRSVTGGSEAGTYKSIGKRHLHKDELALVPKDKAGDLPLAGVGLEWVLSGLGSDSGCRQFFGWLMFNAPHSPGLWTGERVDGRRFGEMLCKLG